MTDTSFSCSANQAQQRAAEQQLQQTLDIAKHNNARLEEALLFATHCHAGQLRKGTTRPYIFHPLETMLLLSAMQADTELLIAGLLHDVLEDTNTEAAEIEQRFGKQVRRLVCQHSEDKTKPWLERKATAIQHLQQADLPAQMLVLADKLSNLRSMARDYQVVGEQLWERFHAPKEKQAWYYNSILKALYPLQDFANTADLYKELTAHYKDLFVTFKITPDYNRLYQADTFGESFCLTKGNPIWQPVTYRFRQNDILLTREEAESLEDKWYDLFLNAVEQDLQDKQYVLANQENLSAVLTVQNAQLTFQQNTHIISLDEEDTYTFFTHLRIGYGLAQPLQPIFEEFFGYTDGIEQFFDFCEPLGIQAKVTEV